jgi:hypothetical protein
VLTSACQSIWASAGRPLGQRGGLAEDVPGVCALCGHVDDWTVPLTVACPPASFGGWQQMRWPSSDRVCRACTWAMEGRPPDTLRMWSVLYVAGGVPAGNGPDMGPQVHACNRGAPERLLEALCWPPDGPWALGVAESGKVHVVPYMVLNEGPGAWAARVDRMTLRGTPGAMRHIVHHFAALLAVGYSATKILERAAIPGDLVRNGIAAWREHITQLGGATAGATERLAALFIKKEAADGWRERTAGDA